jgi:hypothetical protein
MSQTENIHLVIKLSHLESYIPGLLFPAHGEGSISPTSILSHLLPGKVEVFLFEPVAENTILDIFPFLMFRTQEYSLPQVGDMKEIRLLGLYGRGNKVSLNSYVRGNATIMERRT